jgi:hypothetical protein
MTNQKEKEKILLAMYRSVDRANKHWTTGNKHGIISKNYVTRMVIQNRA